VETGSYLTAHTTKPFKDLVQFFHSQKSHKQLRNQCGKAPTVRDQLADPVEAMYPPVELLEVMDVLADALSDAVLDLFRNQPDVVLRAMASLTLTVEEREQREADKARDWRKSGRSAMRTGDEILRKCIPLLASDKPGEVIAAAQAICKVVQGAGISLNDFAAAVTRFLELDSDMIRIFAPLAFNPSTLCDESDPTGEFNLRHWTFRRTQALDFVERPEFFHIPAKLKAAVRSFLATKPHIVTEGENDTLRAQRLCRA
jgi:hypothetical protein